ncbi:MAG: hypothetical protein U0414_30060 [Polyangiaceae bacterium]
MSRIISPDEGIDCDLLDLIDPHDLPYDEELRAAVESRMAPSADPRTTEVVRVISRMKYSLQGAAGVTQSIPLAVGIDTSRWRSGSLVVRLYSQTSWPAGSIVSVATDNVLVDEDSPNLTFVGEPRTSQTISAATPPALYVKALAQPIGPQLRVVLDSHLAVAVGLQEFELAVDLIGRFN